MTVRGGFPEQPIRARVILVRLLLLGLAILAANGCQSSPPLPGPGPPAAEGPWQQRLQARGLYWQRAQILYRVAVRTSRGKASVKAIVTEQLPHSVRIEVSSIWGQTYGVFTQDPDGAELWLPSQNKFYRSRNSALMMEHLLGIPIPAETLIQLMLACSGPGPGNALQVKGDSTNAPAKASADAAPEQWLWQLQVRNGRLAGIAAQYRRNRYVMSYDPPLAMDDRQVPHRIQLDADDWQLQAEALQARQLEQIEPSLFRLAPPAGVETLFLRGVP